MYSGTTLHSKSGNLIGAHQKFDRVARRFVQKLRPNASFPEIKLILSFEGNNGPDGIKRKSPAVDEPWHYWDPTDKTDRRLLDIIAGHRINLVQALETNDYEKTAFEAAWLAHALVDGLTPAHHYPFEKKLIELRGGEGIETRTSLKDKVVIKGDTKRQMLKNNWKMWGARGLMISHATFEWGVSAVAKPLRLTKGLPSESQIRVAKKQGFEAYLRNQALEIYDLNMYERYLRRGWTTKLGRQARQELCPRIVNVIAVSWILAVDEVSSAA